MVIAAIVGGIAGACCCWRRTSSAWRWSAPALGALLANLIWTQIEGDPHPFVVVLFSVAGALLATWLQRYVIILGTAFGGAWTMLVGGLAVMGDSGDERGGGRRHVGGVSDEPRAGPAVGAVGLDRARPRRHAGADVMTGGQSGRVVKPNKKKAPPKAS